jgi:hypothetical protein
MKTKEKRESLSVRPSANKTKKILLLPLDADISNSHIHRTHTPLRSNRDGEDFACHSEVVAFIFEEIMLSGRLFVAANTACN